MVEATGETSFLPPGQRKEGFGGIQRGTTGFESRLSSYLHERLLVVTRVLIVTLVVLQLASEADLLAAGEWGDVPIYSPERVVVVLYLLLAAGIWLVLRRRRPSLRQLRGLDAALFWGLIAATCLYYELDYGYGSRFLVPFLGVFILIRAITVPSRALRTFLLSLPAPLLVLAIRLLHGDRLVADGYILDRADYPYFVAWDQVYLWVTVGLAAVASRVNFSLRIQAYKAMELGQFKLGESIGRGGMGEVYRAEHAMLKRPTAVKLIRAERVTPQTIRRFEAEVQQTARLTHPNTISIFDYGCTEDGVFYYAMELLNGADLKVIVNRTGPMPASRAIRVLAQAADALAEAHARGLVHRDVKSSNIILCEQGLRFDVAKVMDFGLVKDTKTTEPGLTGVDDICGTPETISPEAIRGRDVGPSADVYGLGAVAYNLVTGKLLFEATTPAEFVVQHLRDRPVSPSEHNPDVPADLEAVILSCLEKAPEDRPASMEELRDALLACADAGEWTQVLARRWWETLGARLRT